MNASLPVFATDEGPADATPRSEADAGTFRAEVPERSGSGRHGIPTPPSWGAASPAGAR